MLTQEARRLGGIAAAKVVRKKHLDNYLLNPKVCKQCNTVILPKDGEKLNDVRVRDFCTRSCAAKFNNKKRIKEKPLKEEKTKEEIFIDSLDKYKNTTKEEFFNSSKNYFSARSCITKIAKRIMKNSNREKVCKNCGYNKHVEVCHIKSVASFPGDATLFEINNEENLIYLCPNCHWEFDNNQLSLHL